MSEPPKNEYEKQEQWRKDFRAFGFAFVRHWKWWVCWSFGSTPFVIMKALGIMIPHWIFWTIALIGVIVASFLTWRDQQRRIEATESEMQIFKSCQDKRALLVKMIDLINNSQIVIGVSRENPDMPLKAPYEPIGALIEYSEEIKNEDEVEWLRNELLIRRYGDPFEEAELCCKDFMKGHRLSVLREARLNQSGKIFIQAQFIKFLGSNWSKSMFWNTAVLMHNDRKVVESLRAKKP